MLLAEAALANPQAGPNWETSTRSSRIVRTRRRDNIVVLFWRFSDFPSSNTLRTLWFTPLTPRVVQVRCGGTAEVTLGFGRRDAPTEASLMRPFLRLRIKAVCLERRESQPWLKPVPWKRLQGLESSQSRFRLLPSTREPFPSLRTCRRFRLGSLIRLSTFTLSCFARAGFGTLV